MNHSKEARALGISRLCISTGEYSHTSLNSLGINSYTYNIQHPTYSLSTAEEKYQTDLSISHNTWSYYTQTHRPNLCSKTYIPCVYST